MYMYTVSNKGNPSLQMFDGLGLASSEESQMHLLPRGPAPAGGGSLSGGVQGGLVSCRLFLCVVG